MAAVAIGIYLIRTETWAAGERLNNLFREHGLPMEGNTSRAEIMLLMLDAMADAVATEREACASVAEGKGHNGSEIAESIRDRDPVPW